MRLGPMAPVIAVNVNVLYAACSLLTKKFIYSQSYCSTVRSTPKPAPCVTNLAVVCYVIAIFFLLINSGVETRGSSASINWALEQLGAPSGVTQKKCTTRLYTIFHMEMSSENTKNSKKTQRSPGLVAGGAPAENLKPPSPFSALRTSQLGRGPIRYR